MDGLWPPKFTGSAIARANRKDHDQPGLRRPRHIDLLVQEGFYSNRTDFIRTAIRNQLATHGEEVRKSIMRHTLELGLRHYTRADLEAVKTAGEKLHIKVLGLATIAPDVTPSLALATIESITVLGALHASKDVKNALADRIR
jgi:Arc/MetJ-type ribon-helix-helix transcriptional regulator